MYCHQLLSLQVSAGAIQRGAPNLLVLYICTIYYLAAAIVIIHSYSGYNQSRKLVKHQLHDSLHQGLSYVYYITPLSVHFIYYQEECYESYWPAHPDDPRGLEWPQVLNSLSVLCLSVLKCSNIISYDMISYDIDII